MLNKFAIFSLGKFSYNGIKNTSLEILFFLQISG